MVRNESTPDFMYVSLGVFIRAFAKGIYFLSGPDHVILTYEYKESYWPSYLINCSLDIARYLPEWYYPLIQLVTRKTDSLKFHLKNFRRKL